MALFRPFTVPSIHFTFAVVVQLLAVLAVAPATAQNQAWLLQLGTSSADEASAAAPDGTGGVYVGGYTSGSLSGPHAGGYDAWLARFDSAGNQHWIRQFGTVGGDLARSAAPDGSGGVFVNGYTNGDLVGFNIGQNDIWLARYDSAGNRLWARQLGTIVGDEPNSAAPDGSGGVYVSGQTYGSLGGPSAGVWDAWLARFNAAGNQLWIRQLGTSAVDRATGAASDGSGGLYVSGITFGSLGGPNAGTHDAWLARYDGTGTQLWIRQFGTNVDDLLLATAPDGSGGVYVGGSTSGNLGGPNKGSGDAWVARYDGAGNQTWIRQLGTGSSDLANAAEVDGSGGVYVSGWTKGSLGAVNAGDFDVWLAHYDAAGNQLWIQQLGTAPLDWPRAAALDGSGGVFVGGVTCGSLGGPQAGGCDAWLARYDGSCGIHSIYCISKTNSVGCMPMIFANGKPSASAGSGFTISTTNVLDNQLGLYFYSKSGANNAPFQGGILCGNTPLVRTMMQNSGGTPSCGGSFQIDFNTYVATGKDPALVAGQQVWIQTWSSDPGFPPPNNTSLSDAITFTLCP